MDEARLEAEEAGRVAEEQAEVARVAAEQEAEAARVVAEEETARVAAEQEAAVQAARVLRGATIALSEIATGSETLQLDLVNTDENNRPAAGCSLLAMCPLKPATPKRAARKPAARKPAAPKPSAPKPADLLTREIGPVRPRELEVVCVAKHKSPKLETPENLGSASAVALAATTAAESQESQRSVEKEAAKLANLAIEDEVAATAKDGELDDLAMLMLSFSNDAEHVAAREEQLALEAADRSAAKAAQEAETAKVQEEAEKVVVAQTNAALSSAEDSDDSSSSMESF